MDVNEAFAPAITLVRPMEGVELPRLTALDREYRVDQQADVETALLISPTIELTRNGMSSLMISSTATPRFAAAGSKPILGAPALRSWSSAHDCSATPASSSGR